MDNNFDENKLNSGASGEEIPAEENFQQEPFYTTPEQSGMPPQNEYIPPEQPPKRRISMGCFWGLISVIIVLIIIVVVLVVLIAKISGKSSEMPPLFFNNTAQAEHVVIELPIAEKPVLEEEFYENKETGLLTPVGVAKTILPSQVQIKTFDEVPYTPVSTGSGVIVTADGYIVTNAHVVDGKTDFAVEFYDGTEAEAVIVGMDKKSDLAVIKVDKDGLTPAQFGTSSNLVIGEAVALAGAGAGFENTVTYGYVTGLGREISTDYINSSTILCIQSDVALNPGNSGGALVNMYGQVVGIAVALMDHETYENIGFSIAVDDAVPIIEDLIAKGYVSTRTKVGISYVEIGDALASSYEIESGLCVMDIDPTCNVASSGILPYDIITQMDGIRVHGADEIGEILAGKLPGDSLTLTVFRKPVAGEGYEFTVDIILEADTNSTSGYSVETTPEEEQSDPFVIE
ncbi:MAG: trypsin-like peptidase domain-containing protein [Oscillospiraceae bacterium]|nr:trypsin-like peptidase domain-containing protein [Oscillospiraceae bacterium]